MIFILPSVRLIDRYDVISVRFRVIAIYSAKTSFLLSTRLVDAPIVELCYIFNQYAQLSSNQLRWPSGYGA